MRSYIKIPIKILTKKIAQNKQDSIFYAGKNIAEVKVRNRTYVLTTAGQYKFSLKLKGPSVSFDSCNLAGAWVQSLLPGVRPPRNFTDAKIKKLNDQIENWGWFGINIWETRPNIPGMPNAGSKDQCLDYPTEVWSTYDEALQAFIDFVEKDLVK